MQGLLAFAGAQCPSFIGHSTRSAPCPKQFLLVGFKHYSFLKCKSKALAPTKHGLKTSLQDGAVIEEYVPSLIEETVPTSDGVAVEEGPKVKVKFVLQKECYFGQRFNVVGNDPLFGNWDVEAAVPMEWAEGNIWTAEVDVPVEKQVEFKYVLTGELGDTEWQPGLNRMFKTGEDISPLVVAEPWLSVDEAAVVEVPEELSEPAEDMTPSNSGGLLVPAFISGVGEAAKEQVVAAKEEVVAAKEEVVEAFESKVDDTNGQPNSSNSESETESKVPLAELVVAATAVEAALGVNNAV